MSGQTDDDRTEPSTESPDDTQGRTESPPGTSGGPESQDVSEAMNTSENTENTEKNPAAESAETTQVLPPAAVLTEATTQLTPAATPPTQEIAQATSRIPDGAAPEGEVHPAYGAAAARVQAEEAAAAVHDAPAHDDDPLAPLRDSAPQAAAGATTGTGSAPAGASQDTPAATTAQADRPADQAPVRRPRVGTAVWGLIVIAVGLGILAVAAGVMFDLGVALIVLLGVAGVILVVGSVVSSLRRR